MSRYDLKIPDSLLENAKQFATREHTSINQLFIAAIAEKISQIKEDEERKEVNRNRIEPDDQIH